MKRGLLIVISGPSGVGKDTLIRRLLEVDPKLKYSVSGTTRKPRPGEKPDENYTFLTRDQFESLAEKGAFLEHATYNGHLYGTYRDRVERARIAPVDSGRNRFTALELAFQKLQRQRGIGLGERVDTRDAGQDMVLKIDVQGAEQVRQLLPDAILIFVVAPTEEELKHRQEQRGSESAQDLASRRQIAEREMTYVSHYDHVVTNDDIERATGEILDLIRRARERQT